MSRACRLVGGVCAYAVALAIPGLALAQVYKCVDRAGRTTYQQQPCPDTQKGGRLSLSIDNGSTRQDEDATEAWDAAVKQKRVLAGMPRAFVIRAFGSPQTMRPGNADESATEVWVYKRGDLETRVGFRGGVVAWSNDVDPAGVAPPDPSFVSARKALTTGMSCAPLESALGSAESTLEEFDSMLLRTVVRVAWAPTVAEPERTVVTCDSGVVARIDRTPMQP